MTKTTNKPTIFSGIQPSGNIHIGNYLGAIRQWVDMQDANNCIFCVVDYHAITVKQDPKILKQKIIEVAKIYLAAGIDPKKSIIFQQSDISAHTELAWILNCVAVNIADLYKMTQFKNKVGYNKKMNEFLINTTNISDKKFEEFFETKIKEAEKIAKTMYSEGQKNIKKHVGTMMEKLIKSAGNIMNEIITTSVENFIETEKKINKKTCIGLFDYPALMAADILLYNTDIVPVGDDQVQHVELTRDLARRFNYQFGETLKIPAVKIKKESARIMGLDNPENKMSKSAASEANYIALTDEPAKAAKKIMRAVTDTGKEVIYDKEKKPGITNLLVVYSALTEIPIKDLEKEYKDKGYGDFKKGLAEEVKNFLTDFQEKYDSISDKEVRKILDEGTERARPIAEETLRDVKKKLGVV